MNPFAPSIFLPSSIFVVRFAVGFRKWLLFPMWPLQCRFHILCSCGSYQPSQFVAFFDVRLPQRFFFASSHFFVCMNFLWCNCCLGLTLTVYTDHTDIFRWIILCSSSPVQSHLFFTFLWLTGFSFGFSMIFPLFFYFVLQFSYPFSSYGFAPFFLAARWLLCFALLRINFLTRI